MSRNRHHASLRRYQSTVRRIPSAKVICGSQPSGRILFVSIAYDRSGPSFKRRLREEGLPQLSRIASASWLLLTWTPAPMF